MFSHGTKGPLVEVSPSQSGQTRERERSRLMRIASDADYLSFLGTKYRVVYTIPRTVLCTVPDAGHPVARDGWPLEPPRPLSVEG